MPFMWHGPLARAKVCGECSEGCQVTKPACERQCAGVESWFCQSGTVHGLFGPPGTGQRPVLLQIQLLHLRRALLLCRVVGCPERLAHFAGAHAGVKIGPNSTLVFEVELLKVEKGDAPKAAAPKSDPANPKKK